jgi:hypothetical protein
MLIPLTPFYGFFLACLPDNCFADSHSHNGDNSVVAVEDVESVMRKIESSCRWVSLNLQFHQIRNLNHHFADHHQVLNYCKEPLRGLRIPPKCFQIFLFLLLSVLRQLIQLQDSRSILKIYFKLLKFLIAIKLTSELVTNCSASLRRISSSSPSPEDCDDDRMYSPVKWERRKHDQEKEIK